MLSRPPCPARNGHEILHRRGAVIASMRQADQCAWRISVDRKADDLVGLNSAGRLRHD
jgi:hypothetical protein